MFYIGGMMRYAALLLTLILVTSCSKSESTTGAKDDPKPGATDSPTASGSAKSVKGDLAGPWLRCKGKDLELDPKEACAEMAEKKRALLFLDDGTHLDIGNPTSAKYNYTYSKGAYVREWCIEGEDYASRKRIKTKVEGDYLVTGFLSTFKYYKRAPSEDVRSWRAVKESLSDRSCKSFPVLDPKVEAALVGTWKRCGGKGCDGKTTTYYTLGADGQIIETYTGLNTPSCTEQRVRTEGSKWLRLSCDRGHSRETIDVRNLTAEGEFFTLEKKNKEGRVVQTEQFKKVPAADVPVCKEIEKTYLCGFEDWHKHQFQ